MRQAMLAALVAVAGLAGDGAAAGRVAGPHKGRIVEVGSVRVEFAVDKARKAHVYVLDAANAAADAGAVTATIRAILKTGGKAVPMAATTAGFDGGSERVKHLASRAALPSPDGYLVVLSVKAKGKTANARFELTLHTCGGCGLAEYACICGH